MPYEWLPSEGDESRLHLWPCRSLSKRGFVGFIGVTAALFALPLLVLLGSPVLWGLLPFVLAAIAAIWWALQRSYHDGEILEDLRLTQDRITLTRHGPKARRQDWSANRYWVRVERLANGGPVPHYLILKGGPRDVEIGAFLSEDERVALHSDLHQALRR